MRKAIVGFFGLLFAGLLLLGAFRLIGRYQLVRVRRGMVIRMDVWTGSMKAFAVGRDYSIKDLKDLQGYKYQIRPLAEYPTRR